MNANTLESLAETGTRWANNYLLFLPLLLLQSVLALRAVKPPPRAFCACWATSAKSRQGLGILEVLLQRTGRMAVW